MRPMSIAQQGELEISSDLEQIGRLLPLDGAKVLELGCGRALTTLQLAETFPIGQIIATEVDRVQHQKNLQLEGVPQVRFQLGGAEAIDLPDASVDTVIMLKSLHHVPVPLLDRAFGEIHRVLRPGGLAYLSEPIYAGDFNEVLRLFHDEKQVREAAFAAVQRAVASGAFALVDQVFFSAISRFAGFPEFEELVLGATHSDFRLDPALYRQVKTAFEEHVDANAIAQFLSPQRVDLLQRV